MGQIDISSIWPQLETGITNLAKQTVHGFVKEAQSDGQAFLEATKAKLEQWAGQLAAGKITKDEFSDLLEGQKDLLQLKALTQAGLARIALDKFKQGVLDLVEKVIFALI